MKKHLQKLAIAWIAMLSIIGINKERLARNEEKSKAAPQQQEVMLDEFEISSYHGFLIICTSSMNISIPPFGGIFCYNCRLPPSNTYRPTRS
jgi:hypothetical protein